MRREYRCGLRAVAGGYGCTLTAYLALAGLLCCSLLLGGCGAVAFGPDASGFTPVELSRQELLAQLDAWDGAGLAPELAAQLKAALSTMVAADPRQRFLSAAPTGPDNAVGDLSLSGEAGSRQLAWSYRNVGDYDRNGEVNIADLTPIGLHFQKTKDSADWDAARLADGDENGEVNIADVTPIGRHLLAQLERYRVLAAADGASELLPIGEVGIGAGDTKAVGGFSFSLPPADSNKVFAVEPLDSAGTPGQRSNLVGAGIVLTQLPGPPAALANDNLPQLDFPLVPEEMRLALPGGLTTAADRMGVMFTDEATVGEVNGLLSQLGAGIAGSAPAIDVLVLVFEPLASPAALQQKLDDALASGLLAVAAADLGGTAERHLPPYWDGDPDMALGAQFPQIPAEVDYKSWGLENTRAPQAWSLRDYGLRLGHAADALVIDTFTNTTPYADLDPRLHFLDPYTADSDTHGNDVLRQLGADWGNQLAYDPLNPLQPELYCYDHHKLSGSIQASPIWLKLLSVIFEEGLKPHPSIVAVNMSFGLPQGLASTANKSWMDPLGDLYHRACEKFAVQQRSNFLICSAAGYDGDHTGALLPYDSVANNAAVRYPQGHILAIEALTDFDEFDAARMDLNLGGTVSAPGWNSPLTGTSFATPQVNSLITFLWALKPSLDWQTVKTLVTGEAYTVATLGGSQPRIDAYKAVMGIDALPVGSAIQQALVDVDDGSADGQLRVDPFTGQTVTTIETADGRRGDGRVTMRDFRCWRDAYLQLQDSGPLASRQLDGPALHFKQDLNCDGVIGTDKTSPPHAYPWQEPAAYAGVPPEENVYPRCDFNGDGVIDMQFQPVNQLDRRDIDLLADPQIWQLPEADGYNEGVAADAAQEGVDSAAAVWNPVRYVLGNRDAASNAPQELRLLPDYLHSCDLHLQLDFGKFDADIDALALTVSAELWPDGVDNNGADGVDEPFEECFDRSATLRRDCSLPLELTLPLWTGKLRVSWEALDDELPSPDLPAGQQDYTAQFGADLAATVPGGSWNIQPLGVNGFYAQPAVAEVDGKPAAVVLDTTNKQLLYYSATDAGAAAWNAPVVIAAYELQTTFVRLAEVAGKPCVAYVKDDGDESKSYLYCVGATAADGSAWPAPAAIAPGSDEPYLGLELKLVAGRPALAFVSQTWGAEGYYNNIEYVSAADADGSSWLAPVKVVDYHYSANNVRLADMGGVPGLAWTENVDGVIKTYYSQAAAPAGSGWSAPAYLGDRYFPQGLLYAEGRPALVYYSPAALGLYYVTAGDAQGSSWGSAVLVAEADAVSGNYAGVALVGGLPAVACAGVGATGVRYLQAADAGGLSWSAPQLLESETPVGMYFSLADIGGNPAFGATLDDAATVGVYH